MNKLKRGEQLIYLWISVIFIATFMLHVKGLVVPSFIAYTNYVIVACAGIMLSTKKEQNRWFGFFALLGGASPFLVSSLQKDLYLFYAIELILFASIYFISLAKEWEAGPYIGTSLFIVTTSAMFIMSGSVFGMYGLLVLTIGLLLLIGSIRYLKGTYEEHSASLLSIYLSMYIYWGIVVLSGIKQSIFFATLFLFQLIFLFLYKEKKSIRAVLLIGTLGSCVCFALPFFR